MGERLTEAQRATLEHCPDWSAPYEIAYRRNAATGKVIDLQGQCNSLGWLRNRGFVEYAACNHVFRITPAGR